MITSTTPLSSLLSLRRLDAWYYLAPGAAAGRALEAAKAAGLPALRLGGADGIARVWAPKRFKRAYAAPGEASLPYLAPHDIFEYLPEPTSQLSEKRTRGLCDYRVKRGMVLQTCSGRNLGPSVIVDRTLAQFVMSHDLVRIDIDDERLRNYVVGFMHSKTGQGLLRRDKSGSVIDHITDDHVAAQEIPVFDDETMDQVADLIGRASNLIEDARGTLAEALENLETALPHLSRELSAKNGFTVTRSAFTGRLDAASYDPRVQQIRMSLAAMGGPAVREVATVLKPPGRYKTYYVGREYGLPLLSGTQVLQSVLVKPQYIAERSFDDVTVYELREGWSAYMADGRAEKGLGLVAYITRDRDGWLASGHVGRLVPKDGVNSGALWLAARTTHVQAQLKSLASGSVVDSTFPADMEDVILPPLDKVDGGPIVAAWNQFADAVELEKHATELVDAAMADVSGVVATAAEDAEWVDAEANATETEEDDG
jgi:hypothetical protein